MVPVVFTIVQGFTNSLVEANIYKLLWRCLFEVLLRLQGQPHVPLMWGSGVERTINYIVMQVLSTNLNELRKQCPLKRLSRSTSGRVMQQVDEMFTFISHTKKKLVATNTVCRVHFVKIRRQSSTGRSTFSFCHGIFQPLLFCNPALFFLFMDI